MAATPSIVLSHWYTLIENLQTSSKEFYSSVEEAIKKRQVPDTWTDRVEWREGSILSAKREYLRVRRKDLVFDICAAPFGSGFFVSSWQGVFPSGIAAFLCALPIIGRLFEAILRPLTFYKIDTALMFQSSIHSAVLEVIDGLTKARGLRGLSELERKPILRDFALG